MQKHLTLLFGVLTAIFFQFTLLQTANAQVGTWDDDFIFQILSPSSIEANYVAGTPCSFGGAQFGPDLTEEVEGQMVWIRSATGDSLGCTASTVDLTGKIAVIRRGTCPFSLKTYNAQVAGAVGVVIINHYNTATDGPCTLYNMTGLDSASAVTIPPIFLPRQTGEILTPVLDSGVPVYGKFALPRFYDAAGPYHYATPVSQVDTLFNMGVRYVNRASTEQTDINIRMEITEPGGNVVVREADIASLGAGVDTFVYFPAYLPPAVLGEFHVQLTNNKYTGESRDTIHGKFIHTDHTFAPDDFVNDPGGVGTSNVNFISGGFIRQEGAIVVTGPNPASATGITFGISNIDSVYVPNAPPGSTANDVILFVYDGDVDGDGTIDLGSSFDDLTQVGYGVYTMTGNETDGELVTAPVGDLITGQPVELTPRHVYYSSLLYNGLESGYGRDLRFSNSAEPWFYLNFPSTPLTVGNGTALTFYSGWDGAVVVNRLELEPSSSVKPDVLAEAQVAISPNPATDVVRVDVQLEAPSEMVTLTLFDARGQLVKVQTADNILEGQLSMNVQDIPSGMYLMWVRTAEGSAMRKVAICH